MDMNNKQIQAIYAYTAWILSIFIYIIILLWAFLPNEVIESYGITYYPSKYYALAVPSYMICLYFFVSILYVSYNMWSTVEHTNMHTVCDKYSRKISSKSYNDAGISNNTFDRDNQNNNIHGSVTYHYRRELENEEDSSHILRDHPPSEHIPAFIVPDIGDFDPVDISKLYLYD